MWLARRIAQRVEWPMRRALAWARSKMPRAQLHRWMSRATPPRNPRHAQWQRRYRSRRLQQFLGQFVGGDQLAFDLGANHGEWTTALRALGTRVVSVEPQQECADAIRARFSGDASVTVVQSAVGDAVGRGTLYPATSSSEHASMSDEWREAAIEYRGMPTDGWLEGVEVDVTTLDALIAANGVPALCKIDVEGFESRVLAGLSQPLPAIVFEFHHEMAHVVAECVERLAKLGSYRYGIFVNEWPDRVARDLAPQEVADRVRQLRPDSWGMISARRVGG
jgi:FkbM family methyltransferase